MIPVLAVMLAWLAPACWPPPVAAPVAEPFRAPACGWCPGHRGVGYSLAPGTLVRAVAPGTVSFAGSVAGLRYVVVTHPDGVRVTYGQLQQLLVAAGAIVVAGQPVGSSSSWLHLGVRRGAVYLDPASFLGRWQGRPRLVPVDGPARAGPPPRLVCPAG